MASPISPLPITVYRPNDLPAYLSNGVIGLRVREIPLHNGIAILNGYSGEDPTARVEATPPAPYPLGADLRLGQVWLSEAPLSVRFEEQSYDFSCGELHSAFTFVADGTTARVQVLTFCSRSLPTLALQEITVSHALAAPVVGASGGRPRGRRVKAVLAPVVPWPVLC